MPTTWARANEYSGSIKASAAGGGLLTAAIAPCPFNSPTTRIIGVSLYGSFSAGSSAQLVQVALDTAYGASAGAGMLGLASNVGHVSGVAGDAGAGDFGQYGSILPIWGNGFRVGNRANGISVAPRSLALRIYQGAIGDAINFVRWHALTF
jgi:hypothetical protein